MTRTWARAPTVSVSSTPTCIWTTRCSGATRSRSSTSTVPRIWYWLYDIAVALWELRTRHDYEDFRSALIDGYTRHRPLPPGGLAHIDDFIATREVAFGLWFTGTAQVNPVFRTELDQVQADIGRSLDNLRA